MDRAVPGVAGVGGRMMVRMNDEEWVGRALAEPADAELVALGRFCWCAINLEDRALSVALLIRPEAGPKEPIGERLRKAQSELKGFPQADALDRGITWLSAASRLLQRRNELLHSAPGMLLIPDSNGKLHSAGQILDHVSHRGSFARNEFKAGPINDLANEMRGLVVEWRDLVVDLAEHLGRLIHSKPAESGRATAQASLR
jgi:hypothetical protein